MTKHETYKCGICGSVYETIDERVACETECLAERRAVEEALKKKELEETRKARMEEIENVNAKLNELVRDFIKDYGTIKLSNCYDNFPSLINLLGSGWF